MIKIYYKILIICIVSFSLFSCQQEETFGTTIFDTTDTLNVNASSYTFDVFLQQSYLEPYNLDFRYKMQDVGSDMDYNLVPVSYAKAQQMAKLIKYLWFDVYGTIAGPTFLKENGPRMIHLIGSPAYNPISGTILLGTAEGGIKVTLYRCNELDPNDIDVMNEFYFKTMHHEFVHILHQKRNYPAEYGQISKGLYNPLGWQNLTDSEAASKGFVSPYAGSQIREDFVEIIANYLVKSDKDWNDMLLMASMPGVVLDSNEKPTALPDDGIDGRAVILQKLEMASNWLKNSWSIDIVKLRNEIIEREKNIDEIIN